MTRSTVAKLEADFIDVVLPGVEHASRFIHFMIQ